MLSEGRIDADNVFALRNGMILSRWCFNDRYPDRPGNLTMFLDKETYERAGLVGKPHGAKGGRGLKPRWGKCLFLRFWCSFVAMADRLL